MPQDKRLDSAIAQWLKKREQSKPRPYCSFQPAELRQAFNQQFFSKERPAPIKIGRIKNVTCKGQTGDIKCRVYYPDHQGPYTTLMYFHGGGFVIRDNMDIYDQTCRLLCQHIDCAIVAVDFSLAPEQPFPNAPEDCYTATCWAYDHATELNLDTNHFGVWGESCGGNLSTVVSMMARDRGGPKIKCQCIITAMLDPKCDTPSFDENGGGNYFLTKDSMHWFWQQYISKEADSTNPYCSPTHAKNLANMPTALVATVEYDPLRDEGKQYAEQLKQSHIPTVYKNYAGLIHGFFDFYYISDTAKLACLDLMEIAKKLLKSN